MMRGMNSAFYFVVTDKNTMNDMISKLVFTNEPDEEWQCRVEAVAHPFSQDIIAFEIDSLFTNDIETAKEINSNLNIDEEMNHFDTLYYIDS